MPKSTSSSNSLLRLQYNAFGWAKFADNTATGPLTNIPVALHTAYPGIGGTQATSEVAYTNYIRALVPRSTLGWTVTGAQAVNAAVVNWAQCGATGATAMFWSTGDAATGASIIQHVGVLGSALGPFTGENSNDQITNKGHGLVVNDRVCFFAGTFATLPSGITEGTVYYVKTVVDVDNFTISLTQGGALLDITADGDGSAWKVTPMSIALLGVPSAAIGTLIIDES